MSRGTLYAIMAMLPGICLLLVGLAWALFMKPAETVFALILVVAALGFITGISYLINEWIWRK